MALDGTAVVSSSAIPGVCRSQTWKQSSRNVVGCSTQHAARRESGDSDLGDFAGFDAAEQQPLKRESAGVLAEFGSAQLAGPGPQHQPAGSGTVTLTARAQTWWVNFATTRNIVLCTAD
jgi:hypothetical protein